jgi:hypothetical protein
MSKNFSQITEHLRYISASGCSHEVRMLPERNGNDYNTANAGGGGPGHSRVPRRPSDLLLEKVRTNDKGGLADPDGEAAKIVNLMASVEFEKDRDSKESRYLRSRGILPPPWMLEEAHRQSMMERLRAEADANPGLPLNFCNKKIAEALADPTGEAAHLVKLIAAVKFADDPDSAESRLFREHGFVPSDDQLAYAKESLRRYKTGRRF